jgi:hypothetical protein
MAATDEQMREVSAMFETVMKRAAEKYGIESMAIFVGNFKEAYAAKGSESKAMQLCSMHSSESDLCNKNLAHAMYEKYHGERVEPTVGANLEKMLTELVEKAKKGTGPTRYCVIAYDHKKKKLVLVHYGIDEKKANAAMRALPPDVACHYAIIEKPNPDEQYAKLAHWLADDLDIIGAYNARIVNEFRTYCNETEGVLEKPDYFKNWRS